MATKTLRESVHDLAIQRICPVSGEPLTVYEVYAIENLVSFGLLVIETLGLETPVADEPYGTNFVYIPRDGIK